MVKALSTQVFPLFKTWTVRRERKATWFLVNYWDNLSALPGSFPTHTAMFWKISVLPPLTHGIATLEWKGPRGRPVEGATATHSSIHRRKTHRLRGPRSFWFQPFYEKAIDIIDIVSEWPETHWNVKINSQRFIDVGALWLVCWLDVKASCVTDIRPLCFSRQCDCFNAQHNRAWPGNVTRSSTGKLLVQISREFIPVPIHTWPHEWHLLELCRERVHLGKGPWTSVVNQHWNCVRDAEITSDLTGRQQYAIQGRICFV